MGLFILSGCDLFKSKPEDVFGPEFALIDTEPAWSPDGRTIAYAHLPQDSAELALGSSPYQIWLIDVDGSNKRFVAPGNSVDWSPDGKKLVISDGRIFTIDLETKEVTMVERYYKGVSPAWSPDGSTIAYTNSICSGDTCGVWFSSVDGVNKQYVIKFGGFPTWSPDGQILYYVLGGTEQIWGYYIDSHERKTVLDGPRGDLVRHPAISPDGQTLAWENHVQIMIMDLQTGAKKQLTKEGGGTPCWSPDGSKIVYTKADGYNGHVWIMDADGSSERQLTY
jgi:Tol biopolymer transport system component